MFSMPFPKKTFQVRLAVLCWVEGLKPSALVMQVQHPLGLLSAPGVFFPAGSEELETFLFFLFLLFSIFCVVEQNQGHCRPWS